MDESYGLRKYKMKNAATQKVNSEDFGLKSPVVQKAFQPKKKVQYLYRTTRVNHASGRLAVAAIFFFTVIFFSSISFPLKSKEGLRPRNTATKTRLYLCCYHPRPTSVPARQYRWEGACMLHPCRVQLLALSPGTPAFTPPLPDQNHAVAVSVTVNFVFVKGFPFQVSQAGYLPRAKRGPSFIDELTGYTHNGCQHSSFLATHSASVFLPFPLPRPFHYLPLPVLPFVA